MIDAALGNRLRASRHLVVFTGAGISAESGIPTFRDAQTGLWAKFNPAEVASADAFRNNPQLVWGWYVHRADFVRMLRTCFGSEAGHYPNAEEWAETAVPFLLGLKAGDNGQPLTVP